MTATPTTAAPAPVSARHSSSGHRARRLLFPAVLCTAVVIGVSLPYLLDTYTIGLAATALVLAVLAMSTQLLVGVMRLPAFGQAAPFGIGAYAAALLANAGVTSGVVQLLAATVAGGAAAALTAPLVLRARATPFLMVTFAVQSLTATLAAKWRAVTGGDEGLHTPPVSVWPGAGPLAGPAVVYWYVLACVLVLGAAVAVLLKSRFGLLLRGCAEHEPRMAALGHRVTAELAAGYTAAGALAGAGGALLIAVNRYVSPADMGFEVAAVVLLAAAIGAGTMTGAVAGALAVVASRDLLGAATEGHGLALLGALFLVVAYARPLTRATRAKIRAAADGRPS